MKRKKAKKTSRKLVKLQVKKALEKRGAIKNHRPTVAQAQAWFNILNRGIFNESLEMPTIKIQRMRNAMGECVCTYDARKLKVKKDLLPTPMLPNDDIEIYIKLLPKYKTWKDFIETLAHEMIHLYQMTVLKCPRSNHNADFYLWRNTFKRFGLGLSQ